MDAPHSNNSVRNRRRCAGGMIGALALAAMAALTGCASASPLGSASGNETTPISFALDWTPNTNHTGLYVAIDKGFFTEASLDVQVLPYSQSSTDALINAGAADFGISFQNTATFAAATGVGNVSVMSVLQHDATAIGVLASREDITSPKDLDGKIFGTAGPSATFSTEASHAIKNAGGTGKFTQVTLGTSAYEALYAGKVDFTSAFTTWEGIDASLRGTPMKFFNLSDYGVPDQYSVIVEGNKGWIKEHASATKEFVQALQKGYQYAADNPDAAARILIDANPGVFENTELVYRSQKELSANYLKDATGQVGTQTSAQWQQLADFLYQADLLVDGNGDPLTAPLDTSTLFSDQYLSEK
ncbi:ABC-type nitrate/sulfonate/bicarbonate transport system substrate-binding protein [Cryobacterium psychrophilum]|nr:ABC-type nitrate/sulfonate/bicarbonate transport system substrate-binding protein [Cryobacterium psychrophilum]